MMMQSLILCMVACTLISAYSLRFNEGEMNNDDLSRAFLEVIKLALNKMKNIDDVICPSGTECMHGNTCCVLSSGEYGCCPLPNAVCCDDGQHCCPNGYTCTTGSCSKGNIIVPFLSKITPNRIKK